MSSGGSVTGGGGSDQLLDACALINVDDAQAVLGAAVDTPKATAADTPDRRACSAFVPDALPALGITLYVQSAASWVRDRANHGQVPITAVSGIGDEAVYEASGGPYFVSLAVHRGNVYFVVTVFDGSGPAGHKATTNQASERQFALDILQRLG